MFSFDVVCARARVEREAMAPQVGGWVPSAAAGASLSPPLLGGDDPVRVDGEQI